MGGVMVAKMGSGRDATSRDSRKQGTKLRHWHGTRYFCLAVIFTLTRWCGATQTGTRANTCVVFVVGRDLPGGDIIGVFVPLNTKLLGPANHNVAPPTPADDAATTSNPLCIFRV